jgi:putative ABC transport system substrate-binding protein
VDRRAFVSTVTLVVLAAPLAAEARQTGKIPRIGAVTLAGRSSSTPAGASGHVVEAFRQGMRDLGYIEGRNLLVEYRSAGGRAERLPELLAELVGLEVDIIVTGGTAAALAAKQATRTIPVVIAAMGDPVASGVVSSLAHPGGNITGLSLAMSEGLVAKHLEIIKQVVPNASRVAILWHPSMRTQVKGMERAAQTLGVGLQSIEVQQPGQLDLAFASLTAKRAAALVVVLDPFMFTHRDQIVNLAAKHRLPAIYGFRAFVDDGGLVSYAPNLYDVWRRAATCRQDSQGGEAGGPARGTAHHV